MAEKIIRDPVHDVIAFRIDRPAEALLFRLLNATEFQRLRRIRQLGLASLAYPGADHSRYSHSLGVMETARKILKRLGEFFPIDPEQQALCLVGALLHDVGHGPFSHVFERVAGISHEQTGRRVILDPDGELHRLLVEFDPQLPRRLVDLLECRPNRTFYNDVLGSQLDADRFDYLLRDNLMTGSQYGAFDLGWLVQALTLDPATDRLAVTHKGVSAVENYLQSRYHMYRNVYFHKVVRSAEGMLRLALQRARRLAVQDRLPWPPRDHPVHKALLGQQLSVAEFTDLDDVSMLHSFKLWIGGEDPTLALLCRGLLFRRLFKVVDLSHLDDEAAREAQAVAKRVVERQGGDVDYDLFFDEPADTPYTQDGPGGGAFCPSDGILMRDAQGRTHEFSTTSPLVGALNRQLMFRRLHVMESMRTVVERELCASGYADGTADGRG
jgi:hypothetical protein